MKLLEEEEYLRKLINGRVNRNKRIEDSLQRISRELIIMKFGQLSPFVIEMTLKLPSRVELATITFDLFDVNEIPFSILYFISQIGSGAWDGCSFTTHHSSVYKHVLVAEAIGSTCSLKLFKENSVVDELLAFSEYDSGTGSGYLSPRLATSNGAPIVFSKQNSLSDISRQSSVHINLPHRKEYCLSISAQ